MTFLVALCAEDGVAIASDGLSHRAIEPPEGGTHWLPQAVPKILAVGERTLCAFAGDIPIVQPTLAGLAESIPPDPTVPAVAEILARTAAAAHREAEERYVRLHGNDAGRQLTPRAHFLVGGIDGKTPRLVRVDSSGRIADQTRQRFAVAGTLGPYADYAATMVERYYPARADLATAQRFAFSLLDTITRQGFFRIHPPVHVWSAGLTAPAAETTSQVAPAPVGLPPAFANALRRLPFTAPPGANPRTTSPVLKVNPR